MLGFEWSQIGAALASAGLGGVLVAIVQAWQARAKSADDVAVAGLSALNAGVKILVESLQSQVTHLEGRLGAVSRENADCEGRCAALTRTVGELEGRLAHIEKACGCAGAE